MILQSARKITTSDPEAFAWASLRRYQNVELVEQNIVALHSLERSDRRNARKQARQLRYCLIQAREYFSAAKGVTLATKPTLQYYGLMCLALAEILLKQTGDSSLDRARQQHRHHGLLFRDLQGKPLGPQLEASATRLIAVPHIDAAVDRRGTFELWHRSSREAPGVGIVTREWEGGVHTSGCEILCGSADEQLEPLPANGISLFDCIRSLPGMARHLGVQQLQPLTLRGRMARHDGPPPNQHRVLTFFIHPSNLTSGFLESFTLDAAWVDRTSVRETPSGGGAIIDVTMDAINGAPIPLSVPHGAPWTDEEMWFWSSNQPLNEFGYLYVALFIAGNYARYFPDKWLTDVETSTPLALAIEELMELAAWRAPWLSLGELGRTCFVLG